MKSMLITNLCVALLMTIDLSGVRTEPARLVLSSGRTSEAVEKLLEDAEKRKTDIEFLNSMNKAHSTNNRLHDYRGYTVVGDIQPIREVNTFSGSKRPIWFAYGGTLTHSLHVAEDLMCLEVFRNSINRCADVLRQKGVDLLHILTASDESIFDNLINAQVSITAMQVALTDLLTHVGITPDGIFGISLGETACAYADGGFTLEQAVLAAYWRAHSILISESIHGKIAIVGLSYEETIARVPSDVFANGHMYNDMSNIGGPVESVLKFMNKLEEEGITTRPIGSLPFAFHTEYLAKAGEKLRESLEQINPNPKNRTSRWISTCFSESDRSAPIAQQNSADYHAHNLVSPLRVYEAIQHIPKNAICIEIGPTTGLQSLLERLVGPESTTLSLSKRGQDNNLVHCLSNIGKLYAAGAQPDVSKL